MGEHGERQLAEHLQVVAAHGWHLLADRVLPSSSGDVDMVVVGPSGGVVVDARNWAGDVAVTANSFRVDGYSRNDAVADALAGCRYGSEPLLGAVCLVGAATVPHPEELGGGRVLSGDHVTGWLWHFPAVLDDPSGELVDADRASVRRFLGGRRRKQSAPVAMLAGQVWRGRGRWRLYVHRLGVDGAKVDLGFFDVHDGLAVCPDLQHETVVR